MTRVLVVRHAQSEWNATGRWQGWADPPLSALGREQAGRAAGGLEGIEVIVSSDLARAKSTAEIMGRALGVGPVVVQAGLRERDVGEWTGLTRAEIAEGWPEWFDAFATRMTPPRGESLDHLNERVQAAMQSMAGAYPDGVVLAVTHGGVVRNLERHLGIEPHPLPNLGGVWVTMTRGEMTAGSRVLLIDPETVEVTVPLQP